MMRHREPSTTAPRVRVVDGAVNFPGGQVVCSVQADPWPDAKLDRIEVDLRYRGTYLLRFDQSANAQTPMGMLLAPGTRMVEGRDKRAPEFTVVDHQVVTLDRLQPAGGVTLTFTLPANAPPSLEGAVNWEVRAHFHRRMGLDAEATQPLTVLGLPVEQVGPAGTGVDDWFTRAPAARNGAATPPDRRQDVRLEFSTHVAAAGDAVTGTLLFQPDVEAFFRAVHQPRTKRGKHRSEEAVQALPSTLEVEAIQVALECWRGSGTRRTMHRIFQKEETIAGPLTLEVGSPQEFPFSLKIPLEGTLKINDNDQVETRVPGTFHAAALGHDELDDLRWRVVARGVLAKDSLRHLPTTGNLQTYSGEHAESPLWAAEEVVVRA